MKKIIITFLLFALAIPLFSATLDKEVDKYWGEKRKIVVIQKKEFTKKHKFELSIFSGMVPNDAFYNAFPIGLKFDWFLTEHLSFGLFGSYLINTETSTIDILEKEGVKTKFAERVDWNVSISTSYSIIYGKAAFRKTTLSYFDLYGTLFASIYGTRYYKNNTFEETSRSIRFGGGLGLGIKFYITQHLSMSLEGRQHFFARTSKSDGGRGGVQKPLELTISFGWLF